jgi:hypothetical protein
MKYAHPIYGRPSRSSPRPVHVGTAFRPISQTPRRVSGSEPAPALARAAYFLHCVGITPGRLPTARPSVGPTFGTISPQGRAASLSVNSIVRWAAWRWIDDLTHFPVTKDRYLAVANLAPRAFHPFQVTARIVGDGAMKLLTKAGLAAAKARAKLTDEARAMGRSVLAKRATDKAAGYAVVIRELQAAGVTSLGGIARALNERGILTARGRGTWQAVQVSRVLARIGA